MSNEIIKFNYNSSHNNFPAIESLNPIDIGTERQFRFTAKMLETMFDVSLNTIKNRIETLVKVGDLSVQNFDKTNLPDSRGSLHETTIYDLTVLNKLAMTMIDNPIAVNVRKAFNDVIVQVETTGQYNTQKQDPSYMIEDPIERAKAWIVEQEAKRALEVEKKQLEADNEILTQERDHAIATKAQISTNREAVALGRVGGLVNAINKLKDTIFGNREYRTIRAIAALNHLKDKDINWRRLKAYCIENHLEIREVADEKFGSVKSYPIESLKAIYPQLMID